MFIVLHVYLSFMKRGLLFLSLFFFVLHASVPHRHHDELTKTEHEKEHQIQHHFLGYFSLALHNNLGSHHLQDALISHSLESLSSIQQDAIDSYLSPEGHIFQTVKTKKSSCLSLLEKRKTKSCFSSDGHRRGPPVLFA
jgi:hypothetical protein